MFTEKIFDIELNKHVNLLLNKKNLHKKLQNKVTHRKHKKEIVVSFYVVRHTFKYK